MNPALCRVFFDPILALPYRQLENHKIMLDYFIMGGPLFMGILTLILLLMIYGAVRKRYVKELGLLALAVGFMGQLLGLFGAFEGIEQMGGVSQPILAGGLKVSSITSVYGLLIYIVSLVIQIARKFTRK